MKNSKKSKERPLKGRIVLHADGYGFVVVENSKDPDIFVPPYGVGSAMNGDIVEVSLTGRSKRRKPEGKVVRVSERKTIQMAGTFKNAVPHPFVLCERGRQSWVIKIPHQKTLGAGHEQTVIVKITQYPEEGKKFEGEVVKLLGNRQEPATEIQIIIGDHHLAHDFPAPVLGEARALGEEIPPGELEKREDLRHLPIVTIDGEHARDFDDGILVTRSKKGYRLLVAIADVSHFVRSGSALDREAYGRATSVYFPSYCIPMLPEALSNGLCSLKPHEERLCFVAEMDFDRQGNRGRSRFYKAVMKNAARLTYTKVQAMLVDGDEALRNQYARILPHLEVAYELFQLLRERRLGRGSLDFDLPEPEIVLDMEEGIATSIVKASRTQAHMLIEEFMVAANESVAEYAADRETPMIYRIHDSPNPEKMEDFRVLAHNLGHSLPPKDMLRPKDLADLIQGVRGRPYERLINTLLLRSLKQAVYSIENIGHFGLASKKYTHFTSPIRRYPDLIVHRLLEASVHSKRKHNPGVDPLALLEQLSEAAAHCSKMERNAMEAEWEVRDLHVALFMKDKVGEEYEGIISSVTKFGFFVELLIYFVEGLVHVSNLKGDHYIFDDKRHELIGSRTRRKFKIGDKIQIKVVKVDIEQRRLDFWLVET